MRQPRYLLLEEAAEFLRRSPRSLHGLTCRNAIPCRRLPGTRRLLFLEEELAAWIDGCALEVLETADGGKVVRPLNGAQP